MTLAQFILACVAAGVVFSLGFLRGFSFGQSVDQVPAGDERQHQIHNNGDTVARCGARFVDRGRVVDCPECRAEYKRWSDARARRR